MLDSFVASIGKRKTNLKKRLPAFPFSACSVKTAFAVCAERSAAPFDAGWCGGTRVNLTPSTCRYQRSQCVCAPTA